MMNRSESRQHEAARLRALKQMMRSVLAAKSLNEAMEELIRSAIEDAGARSGLVMLAGESRQTATVFAAEATAGYVEAVTGPLENDSALHDAITRQKSITVVNTRTDGRFPAMAEMWLDHGIQSLVATPLITVDGRSLGALELHFAAPRRVSTEDFESMAIHAEMGVALIARAADDASKSTMERAGYEEAIRRRQEINAIVCHDLRNPLLAILTSASLLQRTANSLAQDGSQARARKQIELIQRCGKRMAHLLEDLLDLGQIETGRFRIDLASQSVSDVIFEAIESIQEKAREKSIVVDAAIDPPDALFHCDRERLLQVLGNFLGNAVKFTPNQGSVRISAQAKGWRIVFTVEDSGVGISPENLPHIFEPYWQGKRKPHEGVGLGLSIAKSIVEAHEGSVRVESTVGKGTTMEFDMPAGPRPEIATEIAPFLGLTVAEAQALLERAKDDGAWDAGSAPGIRLMPCCPGACYEGAQSFLVHVPAGQTYPEHEHVGDEHVFVYQGGLRDNDGIEVWEGQRGYRAHGTRHASKSIAKADCLLVALVMPNRH